MTEFITRSYGNKNFEIIIKTDSKEHYKATQDFARRLIDHAKPAPTIEAKPVVHCKDCKYWCANYCTRPIKDRTNMFPMGENDFCSCGAQMSGDSLKNNTQKADVDKHLAERGIIGEWVKIPVISMEDVPKIMEEMEK